MQNYPLYLGGLVATDDVDKTLGELYWSSATEMTTAQFSEFMAGRKSIFDSFYERVVAGMRRNERKLMRYIADYRDKNVDILSSPYLLGYTKFEKEDSDILYEVTGVREEEITAVVNSLKKFIRTNCKALGIMPPDFKNTTPFRMLLLLVMRYYVERGEEAKLAETCSYMAYSMFYTLYYNSFRNITPRYSTMVYTINNMTNKYTLKQQKTVDAMLTYPVRLCMTTYAKMLLECTDQGLMYIIGQIKSRIRDNIKNIRSAYTKNDMAKNATFSSKEILSSKNEDSQDGESNFVERASTAGDIERLAQQYTTRFFQKPVDAEIVSMVARLNQVSRAEIQNALNLLAADTTRISQVKEFHECIFYLYLSEDTSSLTDVHSKSFLAAMDGIYKKGNSKDKNIVRVKDLINEWLEACSPMYKEVSRPATLNNLRKSIYQYFIFTIVMRK